MIYCTYSTQTNALLGVSETQPELSDGQSAVVVGRDMPDFATEEWNPATLTFIAKAVQVLSKLEYLRRFTQDERIAIRAAATQSPVLADYLAMLELAEEIRIGDADTVGAVYMLEQTGLIATGRAAEILG